MSYFSTHIDVLFVYVMISHGSVHSQFFQLGNVQKHLNELRNLRLCLRQQLAGGLSGFDPWHVGPAGSGGGGWARAGVSADICFSSLGKHTQHQQSLWRLWLHRNKVDFSFFHLIFGPDCHCADWFYISLWFLFRRLGIRYFVNYCFRFWVWVSLQSLAAYSVKNSAKHFHVRVLEGFDPDLLQTLKSGIVRCSVSCSIDAVVFTHQPTFLENLFKLTTQSHKTVGCEVSFDWCECIWKTLWNVLLPWPRQTQQMCFRTSLTVLSSIMMPYIN